MTTAPPLSESELRVCVAEAVEQRRCAACTALWRPGWESISGAMRISHLECIGSLVPVDGDDRLDEFHPEGTHLWSPQAPIALGWYPYNRCTLWRCRCCAAAFLRYTEYGGYYEEERIRPLQTDLIVTPRST